MSHMHTDPIDHFVFTNTGAYRTDLPPAELLSPTIEEMLAAHERMKVMQRLAVAQSIELMPYLESDAILLVAGRYAVVGPAGFAAFTCTHLADAYRPEGLP